MGSTHDPRDRLAVDLAIRLVEDFSLDAAALAGEFAVTPDQVEPMLFEAKQSAARTWAYEFLNEHSDAAWPDFFRHVLPGRPFEDRDADRQDLLRAYRRERAIRALLPAWPATSPALTDRVRVAFDAAPPIESIAAAARGVGTVVSVPDSPDGVVRGVPLAVQYRGRMIPHTMLAAAAALRDVDPAGAVYENGAMVLTARSGDGARHGVANHPVANDPEVWRLPIDARGLTPIPWHLPAGVEATDWRKSFPHLPVGRIMEIVDAQGALAHNRRLHDLHLVRLVAAQFADAPAGISDFELLVRRREGLLAASKPAAHPPEPVPPAGAGTDAGVDGDARARAAELAVLNRRIEEVQANALQWLGFVKRQCDSLEGPDDALPSECVEARQLAPWFTDEASAAHRARQAALVERIKALEAGVQPLLRGKVCLVGVTATSAADFIATPVYDHVPGVVANANVLNGLLTNRFVRLVGAQAGLALVAGCAVAATILVSLRGPWFGVTSLAAVAVAAYGLAATAFAASGAAWPWLPAVMAAAAAWALVTLARQLTDQRRRRRIIHVLGQYTSPPIAARVADAWDEAGFEPRRAEVTCFFTDLRDFTRLSERVGPERTREILEPFLNLVSDRLIRADALVNKFLGDGVFAFFNAPILPCPDHARRACQTALEICRAVPRLGVPALGGADGGLRLGVGVATGAAAVGDFGTSAKKDYTCIGDPVNLASRLESANAILGTVIIVDGRTHERTGGGFLWRPLGRVRVAGKTEAVAAYELVGAEDDADAAVRDSLAAFASALAIFSDGRWAEAREAFDRCLAMRPDDKVAALYRARAKECLRTPPDPNDQPALDLTVK